jgi:hypothetical protein
MNQQPVKWMERFNQLLAFTALATAFTALAGCASITSRVSRAPGSSAQIVGQPIPRVQDCGVLQTGTPSRFVCKGKVYTAYELATLREDEAKKYASGK